MKERTRFILEWELRREATEDGRVNVAALCRQFGVSRDAGHRWIRRYLAASGELSAVLDKSSRPSSFPTMVEQYVEDLVVAARKAFPRFGPKKIRSLLLDKDLDAPVPASSTIGEILKRRGLSQRPKKRRRRNPPFSAPFADIVSPNSTWCADFKGQFRTRDGRWCYPLTIIDAHTRFLVRCEILREQTGDAVMEVFDSAFQQYGLPRAIRTDNGPPFASGGLGSLTPLTVWWIKLGIRPERIAPGKPQQNGRQERFHRTLKAETASPPAVSSAAQQRAFDLFRRHYNLERPHEALGQRPPARFYERSTRHYPRKLRAHDTTDHDQRLLTVNERGAVHWARRSIFVSNALAGELVRLEPTDVDGESFDIHFHHVLLGRLVKNDNEWRVVRLRRARQASTYATAKGRTKTSLPKKKKSNM